MYAIDHSSTNRPTINTAKCMNVTLWYNSWTAQLDPIKELQVAHYLFKHT